MFFRHGQNDLVDRQVFERASRQQRTVGGRLSHYVIRKLAGEVIHRLSDCLPTDVPREVIVSPERLEQLCEALVWGTDERCLELVEDLREEGASLRTIYLAYLGGAASLLGEWWEDDRASFAEVTIGVGRMYAILRALRPVLSEGGVVKTRRAVFAAVPGEQHFLGVSIAAEMFKARGWEVSLRTGNSHDELVDTIGESDVPFIGLTSAGKSTALPLARLVVALRVRRPDAFILVSGHLVDEDPGLVDLSGADFTATDVEIAYDEMERVANAE